MRTPLQLLVSSHLCSYNQGLVSGTTPDGCKPTPRPTPAPAPTTPPPPTLPPSAPPAVTNGREVCAKYTGKSGWTCETTGVIVLTYKRPNYLRETLETIFKAHPDPEVRNGSGKGTLFPIIVSQDGEDKQVSKMIEVRLCTFMDACIHSNNPLEPVHFGHERKAS